MSHAELAQETYGDDLKGLVRYLKFMLKNAHRQIGKQGDTIHLLRAEIAEVRSLNSRLERGELRGWDKKYDIACQLISGLMHEIENLREKLDAVDLDELADETTTPE
jgi:FtsZ-binding cell division protein ZapB